MIATDAAGNASDAQSVTLDINDLDDVAPDITSGVLLLLLMRIQVLVRLFIQLLQMTCGDDVCGYAYCL